MPPIKRFQKEEIVDTAYRIVEKEGFDALNARRIAKELGASVQVIYHNFSDMNELNKEVYAKIFYKYQDTMKLATDKEKPYLAKGIAYVKFAREYPEFYKVIFMQESEMNLEEFILADINTTENVMLSITKKFDISEEDLKDFHIKVWIFTHGLACLIATKTVKFSDDEVRKLLMDTVQEMFRGYSVKKERRNNE